MPDEPEAQGLLALMLLHDSRRAARVDDARRARRCSRSRTARCGTAAGSARAARCSRARCARRRPVPTSCRRRSPRCTRRRTAQDTDWRRSRRSTAARARAPSPVVEVNRAVAVGRADGPARRAGVVEPLLRTDARGYTRCTPRMPTCCAAGERRRPRAPTSARRSARRTRSPGRSWSVGRRRLAERGMIAVCAPGFGFRSPSVASACPRLRPRPRSPRLRRPSCGLRSAGI